MLGLRKKEISQEDLNIRLIMHRLNNNSDFEVLREWIEGEINKVKANKFTGFFDLFNSIFTEYRRRVLKEVLDYVEIKAKLHDTLG